MEPRDAADSVERRRGRATVLFQASRLEEAAEKLDLATSFSQVGKSFASELRKPLNRKRRPAAGPQQMLQAPEVLRLVPVDLDEEKGGSHHMNPHYRLPVLGGRHFSLARRWSGVFMGGVYSSCWKFRT